jgi:hypothetical protein
MYGGTTDLAARIIEWADPSSMREDKNDVTTMIEFWLSPGCV